jgi:hypothetical protein
MHMIRHDNSDVKEVLDVVTVQTTFQCDRSGGIGKGPSMKSAKSYEVALIITLQMRELASVEGHKKPRRDSRLGCPAERSEALHRSLN